MVVTVVQITEDAVVVADESGKRYDLRDGRDETPVVGDVLDVEFGDLY